MTAVSERKSRPLVLTLALMVMLAGFSANTRLVQAASAEQQAHYKLNRSNPRSVRPSSGSAYVCVPSGFGQKGRCYLRSDS